MKADKFLIRHFMEQLAANQSISMEGLGTFILEIIPEHIEKDATGRPWMHPPKRVIRFLADAHAASTCDDAELTDFFRKVVSQIQQDPNVHIDGLGTFRQMTHTYTLEVDEQFMRIVNAPFSAFQVEPVWPVPAIANTDAEPQSAADSPQPSTSSPSTPPSTPSPSTPSPSTHSHHFRFDWKGICVALILGIVVLLICYHPSWLHLKPVAGEQYQHDEMLGQSNSLEPEYDFPDRFYIETDDLTDTTTTDQPRNESMDIVQSQPNPVPLTKDDIIRLCAENNQATASDTTTFRIIGTQGVHILKQGETLARIALRVYGRRCLWPYIVRHNQIENPDNVKIGVQLQLPQLALPVH